MTDVYLLGAGGHATVVLDALCQMGNRAAGYFDDGRQGDWEGVPYCGKLSDTVQLPIGSCVICCVGDNAARKKIVAEQPPQLKWFSVVHPRATVSPLAKLGEGSLVNAGAIVNARTEIGDHVILNTGCTVDHHCQVGDFVHIAPGVNLCGAVHVAAGSMIGVGAAVLPKVFIGEWATVGANSTVLHDVPSYETRYGLI